MRQGVSTLKGIWTGSPHGGVVSPDSLILPDPVKRFASTSSRLEMLANGHPMMPWLRFTAMLARAQEAAVLALRQLPVADSILIRQAVGAGMPPLAADGHARAGIWREALSSILEFCAAEPIPPAAQAIIAELRQRDVAAIEAMADAFLRATIAADDAGPALYVAAALQVYFTCLAATLPASELRLLPQRGLCPCCGSTPIAGIVTAAGKTPGARYLHCSLCSTAWNHARIVCITCGESSALRLEAIEGDEGYSKAESCDKCQTYAKMFYQAKDMKVDAFADDLASLGLDLMMSAGGWQRHAPNPLLLIG